MSTANLETQADALARNRDFPGARGLLAQVVKGDPANHAAWMKLAAMANAMGDASAALEAANGALTVRPLDFMALMMRAMQLYTLGQHDKAGEAYGRALSQVPDPAAPHLAAVIDTAKARYTTWQKRQYDQIANKVSAVTTLTPKLERFVCSALRTEPFERDGPTHYCYPGLGEASFYVNELFGWMGELEAATDSIQAEFEAVVGAEAAQLVPYINYPTGVPLDQWEVLNNNRDWTAIHLIRNGHLVADNAQHCPQLLALLAKLPQPGIAGAGPNAMFSLLAPGAHIPPHTGITNTRLVCHLPLIVPEGCWFRVAEDTRLWQRGKAWVFDDTVEHEAMNPSAALRVVMIFDIWHPALDTAERDGIRAVIEAGSILHGL